MKLTLEESVEKFETLTARIAEVKASQDLLQKRLVAQEKFLADTFGVKTPEDAVSLTKELLAELESYKKEFEGLLVSIEDHLNEVAS